MENIVTISILVSSLLRKSNGSWLDKRLQVRLRNVPFLLRQIASILLKYEAENDMNKSVGRVDIILRLERICQEIKDPLVDFLLLLSFLVPAIVLFLVFDVCLRPHPLINILFTSLLAYMLGPNSITKYYLSIRATDKIERMVSKCLSDLKFNIEVTNLEDIATRIEKSLVTSE